MLHRSARRALGRLQPWRVWVDAGVRDRARRQMPEIGLAQPLGIQAWIGGHNPSDGLLGEIGRVSAEGAAPAATYAAQPSGQAGVLRASLPTRRRFGHRRREVRGLGGRLVVVVEGGRDDRVQMGGVDPPPALGQPAQRRVAGGNHQLQVRRRTQVRARLDGGEGGGVLARLDQLPRLQETVADFQVLAPLPPHMGERRQPQPELGVGQARGAREEPTAGRLAT